MFLTGQRFSRPASIEAEQLAIRDGLERDRLAIGVLDDGPPVLSFYDEHRRRLALGVVPPDTVGLHLVWARWERAERVRHPLQRHGVP
jgi:hypothetical protein